MFLTAFFLLFGVGCCLAQPTDYLGDDPLENPDLFGGDILGMNDPEERNAIVEKDRIWPGGVVYYEQDPGLSATVSQFVLDEAFKEYEKHTCIRFVKRTIEKDYIRIFPGKGCYARLGKSGGQQPLSLGPRCGKTAIVIHELGHAIGFHHEQCRSDRDEHITIFWDNIREGMADQFLKLKPRQNWLITPFDYDSIMLYGSYTYTKDRKNRKKTMVGKNGEYLEAVASKRGLSMGDIQRVNTLYQCRNKILAGPKFFF